MKKTLLIIGIVLIAAGVLSLLFSALVSYVRANLLDGSPEHYAALKRRVAVFLTVGIVLTVAGVACAVIQTKL